MGDSTGHPLTYRREMGVQWQLHGWESVLSCPLIPSLPATSSPVVSNSRVVFVVFQFLNRVFLFATS